MKLNLKKIFKYSSFSIFVLYLAVVFYFIVLPVNISDALVKPFYCAKSFVAKVVYQDYIEFGTKQEIIKYIKEIENKRNVHVIDAARIFVYENSRHLINEWHDKHAFRTNKMLNIMAKHFQTKHLSCSLQQYIYSVIIWVFFFVAFAIFFFNPKDRNFLILHYSFSFSKLFNHFTDFF